MTQKTKKQREIVQKKVRIAIFPVAGFGTRVLPATKAQPKEMLPVVDKPAIQYLVEEAVAAGIEIVIFVTGRGKAAIENHFDQTFELEKTLVEKGKEALLKEVQKISRLAKIYYVRQPEPLGDGHAINCAADIIGDEPVLVMFGDSLYDADIPPAKQIIDVYQKYGDPVIGLAPVDKLDVSKFGVIKGKEISNGLLEIQGMVEKPRPKDAPSNLVAVGKYVITPEVLSVLKKMDYSKSKEVRLTDAFDAMLKEDRPLYGKVLKGTWLDTGDKLSLMKAQVLMAMKHPEIGDGFKEFLRNIQ